MSNNEDDDIAGIPQVVVLLFLFTGLGVGVLLEQGLSHTADNSLLRTLPYTVILFFLGLVLATLSKSHLTDEFNESLAEWCHIDADLMLFIFLPPLIFGEAMNLSWYHIRTAMPQCMALAGPGVLLGTAVLGMLTKLVLPYDWPWLLCTLYASILSATDTVAVLSIMSEAGASPKLSVIIVGESLFNDGTSMVVFELLTQVLHSGSTTFMGVLLFFLKMTFGSVAFGIIVGYITVMWLRRVNRPLKDVDVASQVLITLTVAYLTFYIAQEVMQVSGVLAIVGAALVLSQLSPPIILNHSTMHTVWSFIEWIGNTVIFLLAGLIIGHRVINDVQTIDWVYLLVLYIMCQFSRCVVIMAMYPVLANSGHKTNQKEAAFIAFAGLRGALGMALGLILVDRSEYLGINGDDANRLFFYVGGVVAMSLLFNGALTSSVLRLLDLGSKDSVEELLIMDQIKRKMRRKINKMVDHMQSDLDITPTDMMEIRMSCSILRPSESITDALIKANTNLGDVNASLGGNIKNSLTARLEEAHLKALMTGTQDSRVSAGSRSDRGKDVDGDDDDNGDGGDGDGDDDDDDDDGDGGGQNDLWRDDSSTDSDISAAHKSFKRGLLDDSIQDPSLVMAARPGGEGSRGATTRGRGASEGVISNRIKSKREKAKHEHAEEREQFRARARSRSPAPVRRKSFGAVRRNNSFVDGGKAQTSGSWGRFRGLSHVGEWIGEATGIIGERQRRYTVGDRQVSGDTERRNRYKKLTEQLDPSRRDNKIYPEMLAHVRTVFLEIVRVKYWKLIEGGKLPRQNPCTQFLLYSVDVGLDLAHMAQDKTMLEMEELQDRDGLGDWHVIEKEIDQIPLGQRLLQFMESCLPSRCGGDVAGNLMEAREQKDEDNSVYMLTAFIEAHEHAQKKIHSFVGIEPYPAEELLFSANDDKDDLVSVAQSSVASRNQSLLLSQSIQQDESRDGDNFRPRRVDTNASENSETLAQQTPEEIRVKAESARVVERAKERLQLIEPEIIAAIKSKQAAMTVLARETELVKTMCEEGLLSTNQAEKLLEEITEDTYLLEWDQGNIFRRRQPHNRANSTGTPFSFMRGEDAPTDSARNSSLKVPLMGDFSKIKRQTNDLM